MSKAGQSNAAGNGNATGHRKLLELSRRLSATIGAEFFQTLAKHLASALAADCVVIAEFIGGQFERCRSVGAWCDGASARFEFELAGSALAQIVLGRPCHWRSRVRSRFPTDALFRETHAEAFVAVPLQADATHTLGAIMAVYRRPLASVRFSKAMLDIFADRAAAELTRKFEEEKLRESDQRYHAFIAKNADAMWRLEFEQTIPLDLPEEEQLERIYKYGYVAECNDAFAHLVGMERADQLVGSGLDKIVYPRDPSIREATLVGIRSGYNLTSVETSHVDASGRRRCMLRSQWGIVEDGQLQRIWGSTRDITDLRHTELALDASEQRMADVVESMRMPVFFLDLNGAIKFCNNYMFDMTNLEADELIGREWLQTLIPAADRGRVSAELERTTPDEPMHFESLLLTKTGTLQVEWDSIVLRSSDGSPAARALIGRNVTEQRALQEQVLQAQKLAGMGRLAGGLAHDFNNLLTIILGNASKLLDGRESSDPAFFSLTQIQRAAERSAELAHRLLTFGRREIYRPQRLDLTKMLEEARCFVESIAGNQIRLNYNLEAELRPVRVDPSHFQQLVLNLAANARDAMPKGGLLTIATANVNVPCDHLPVVGIPRGEYVQLTIADTGTGMSDEVKAHLFEPFFTTKEGKGTGLGLAMAYGIVQQCAGFIRVDSEPGRGTTIRIFLPGVHTVESPAPPKPKHALPGGTETILLVQDGQSLGTVADKTLRDLGYSVWSADGPLQALDICRSAATRIQLMVSPAVTHGLRGEVLFTMVKELQPDIKALLVFTGKESPAAQSSSGAVADVLPRRFSRRALAVKVREVLDRN